MDTPNPFRSLALDWEAMGRSARARMALRRWRHAEPSLAGFDSPADVVARCQRRGDPRAANALVGALLRLAADDDLAARAVLQAVLPSLAARAWRRRWDAGHEGAWDGVEEVDAELVACALERIRELSGTSPEWPAQAIVEVAYARFRWAADVARRRRPRTVPLGPSHDLPAEPADRPDLGSVLVEAVRDGTLRRRDAALIYATRVLGYNPGEIAEHQRRDVRAVRYQRARAERTLVAVSR